MEYKSHYKFNETVIFSYDKMKDWVTDIFKAQGISKEDSELVADTLVDADARNVYSHGCQRVKMYTARIQHNCVNVTGKPHVIVDNDAVAVVNGDNAMGQVVGKFAMELAIEKAKKFGVSFVVANGSNHYGRCAYYSNMALKENMIGISSTIGGGNLIAPWGGKEPRVGNNPFCVAIPAEEHYPVILDMAQSVVAKGKIEMARKTGTDIPKEWGLDSNGNETTDPLAVVEGGSLRPIADYKGSGLAIILSMLCCSISDAAIGPTLQSVYKDFERPMNKGQLFAAIDIGRMTDVSAFKGRIDEQIDFIKDCPKADGIDEVFLPGERGAVSRDKQLRNGIVYPIEVIEEITEVSRQLGVPVPEY